MENIQKDEMNQTLNIQSGVILEEKASSLTQGTGWNIWEAGLNYRGQI